MFARLRQVLHALREPALPGEREAVAAAAAHLPAGVREEPGQFIGRHTAGCGATWGVQERCQFTCAACYLGTEANDTPPLPWPEVREQLDALRAHLGPWGNVQLTAGELTLLPVQDVLRLLHYCRAVQLNPMLMTNGEVLRDDPAYLERLVREGGLTRMATHIDTTQHGRRGLRRGQREADLNPLREEFAALLRRTRAVTGVPLQAAHTLTVTPDNLGDVPDVLRWLLANADVYRMASFQPVAQVGRTRVLQTLARAAAPLDSPGTTGTPGPQPETDALWAAIEAGIGRRLDPRAVPFGHADCTSITPLLVVTLAGRQHVVEGLRAGSRLDRWFIERVLLGGLAGYNPIGERRAVSLARLCGRLVRHPRLLLDLPAYAACRLWSERALTLRLLGAMLTRRAWSARPLTIVVHRFMDADELATERGRERLAACTFRVPVDGELVSMCAFNATGRRRAASLAQQRRAHAASSPDPDASVPVRPSANQQLRARVATEA